MNWRRLIGFRPKYFDYEGLGPEFPASSGDRERGRFRESQYPRLVQVAVSNDDGTAITAALQSDIQELTREVRLLRQSLVMVGLAAPLEELVS